MTRARFACGWVLFSIWEVACSTPGPEMALVTSHPARMARVDVRTSSIAKSDLSAHGMIMSPRRRGRFIFSAPSAGASGAPHAVSLLPSTGTPVIDSSAEVPAAITKNAVELIAEPSVAIGSKISVVTFNKFAAVADRSGGAGSYAMLNPFLDFPDQPQTSFWGDQVTVFAAGAGLMLRIEASQGPKGQGLRLLTATEADAAAGKWQPYDFQATQPQTERLDAPDLTVTAKYLYITASVTTGADGVVERGWVTRVPLDDLKNGAGTSHAVTSEDPKSKLKVPRATAGASSTMYFGSMYSATEFAVCKWLETDSAPTCRSVPIAPYTEIGVASSNGLKWFGRADSRVSAGWAAAGMLGFGWTVGGATLDGKAYPYPNVRMLVFDESMLSVSADWLLASPDGATSYPATAPPDANGRVGLIVASSSSGKVNPSLTIGAIDVKAGTWARKVANEGTNAPVRNVWGDYLTIRQVDTGWESIGFVLDPGTRSDSIHIWRTRFH